MASIIKNQIIKHLSAFARNLTPNQISVEVLRGKGELRNIELNEVVLTERLELPPWLKIVKAVCNKVTVKVPWTKLKTYAVELEIEEIDVVLLLSPSSPVDVSRKAFTVQTGKPYDYAERVIEGLSISVQTLTVQFQSDCFGGSLMFQRLLVASKTPLFKDEKDLHLTRVHDKSIHQLIFFKQISWAMCKIEASALNRGEEPPSAAARDATRRNSPLRLITNSGGKCNIAIKKNDLNCFVISSRIQIHLGDILWMATLLQVRSAIDFYKHIRGLIRNAERMNNSNDGTQSALIDLQPNSQNLPSPKASNGAVSKAFLKFDVPRSSYHFHVTKIDLCFLDDSSDDALPPDWAINDGAIQAVLHELRVDFYPSHRVYVENGRFADRTDWVNYPALNACKKLAEGRLNNFYEKLRENSEPSLFERISRLWPSLHSRNVVIRVEDIVVQCVSEETSKKDSIQQLFGPSKLRRPDDLPTLPTISFFHMELSSYYLQASSGLPLPPDSSHIVFGPLEFFVDYRTIRWIVYVFENIFNAFDEPNEQNDLANGQQPDFCAEFVESTIVMNAPELSDDQRLPKRFSLNFANLSLCNFVMSGVLAESIGLAARHDAPFSPHASTLDPLTDNATAFVRDKESEFLNRIPTFLNVSDFLLGVQKFRDMNEKAASIGSIYRTIDDVQLFISSPSVTFASDFGRNSYETPIISAVSLLVTLSARPSLGVVLARPRADVDVLVDHFQLVRLMQLQTRISDLIEQIDADRRFFAALKSANSEAIEASKNNDLPLAVFCDLQRVNIHLLLPTGSMPSPYELMWPAISNKMDNIFDTFPLVQSSLRSAGISNETLSNKDLLLNAQSAVIDQPIDMDLCTPTVARNTNPFLSNDDDDEEEEEEEVYEASEVLFEPTPQPSAMINRTTTAISTQSASDNLHTSASANALTVMSARAAVAYANLDGIALARNTSIASNRRPAAPINSSIDTTINASPALRRAKNSTASLASTTLDMDRMSIGNTFDDAVSVSASDYERMLAGESASMIGDFGGEAAGLALNLGEDAELAEEAIAQDERERWASVRAQMFARRVNTLDTCLTGISALVVVASGPKLDKSETKVNVVGTATTFAISERLNRVCEDLYSGVALAESRMQMPSAGKEKYNVNNLSKEVLFGVRVNENKEALIQVNVNGAGKTIRLSDDVVAQLGPFVENSELDNEPSNPPELRLSIRDMRLEIQNSKKRHPLRIRLDSAVTINDGPSIPDENFN